MGLHNLISIQESPCKKWCKLIDVNLHGTAGTRWMTMYIIQEGDALADRDGNPVPNVSPGDIMRLTMETVEMPMSVILTRLLLLTWFVGLQNSMRRQVKSNVTLTTSQL